MTAEEHLQAHDRQIADIREALGRLANAAEKHAAAVESHDHQIEELLLIAEKQRAAIEAMGHQWQAYVNRLPPQ